MKVYTQEVAKDIITVFEDVLDEHGIMIPDDDRTGDEGEAAIYGMTFAEVLENVEAKIIELLKQTGVEYIEKEWNSDNDNSWFE